MKNDKALHGAIGVTPLLFAIVYLWNPWGQRGLVVDIVLYALAVGALARNPFKGKPRSALAMCIVYGLAAAIVTSNEVIQHSRRGVGWVVVFAGFAIIWGIRFDRDNSARYNKGSTAVTGNHG